MTWRDYPCRVVSKSHTQSQYRKLYQKQFGPLPSHLFVCHRCDNKLCDEPNHWFVGTAKDNTQDCIGKGRFHFHAENLTPLHPQHGERNGNAKLTEAQVREIRASTRSARSLAPYYGVSTVMVCNIRRRVSWRCVA